MVGPRGRRGREGKEAFQPPSLREESSQKCGPWQTTWRRGQEEEDEEEGVLRAGNAPRRPLNHGFYMILVQMQSSAVVVFVR